MAEFRNYSFLNVNLIFGAVEIQGFADGDDAVQFEPETNQFNDLAGAKGDVVRSQTNDNRATVRARLLQNSGSNTVLKEIYNLDVLTGTGVFPMTLEDKQLGEIITIKESWIQIIPTVTRGQGVNVMEWIFRGSSFTII